MEHTVEEGYERRPFSIADRGETSLEGIHHEFSGSYSLHWK